MQRLGVPFDAKNQQLREKTGRGDHLKAAGDRLPNILIGQARPVNSSPCPVEPSDLDFCNLKNYLMYGGQRLNWQSNWIEAIGPILGLGLETWPVKRSQVGVDVRIAARPERRRAAPPCKANPLPI